MSGRLSKWGWAMAVAKVTAQRSTCLRRHVGCVLVDQDFYILATGHNGVAAGMAHCNKGVGEESGLGMGDDVHYPNACPGSRSASGTNLDGCHAIHAEQNALLRCRDPREIFAAFCTASPCMTCVKLLMNTGCRMIYFDAEYPHSEAQELWTSSRGQGTWIRWTHEMERKTR